MYIDFVVSHYEISNFISIFYSVIVPTISIDSKPKQYKKPIILLIHAMIKSLWIYFLMLSWFFHGIKSNILQPKLFNHIFHHMPPIKIMNPST